MVLACWSARGTSATRLPVSLYVSIYRMRVSGCIGRMGVLVRISYIRTQPCDILDTVQSTIRFWTSYVCVSIKRLCGATVVVCRRRRWALSLPRSVVYVYECCAACTPCLWMYFEKMWVAFRVGFVGVCTCSLRCCRRLCILAGWCVRSV